MKQHITRTLAVIGILISGTSALTATTASQINRARSERSSLQCRPKQSIEQGTSEIVTVKRSPFAINRAQGAASSLSREYAKSVPTRRIESSRQRTPSEVNRLRGGK